MNPLITVVILTRNEADNIARCLQSLQWADELVVVDDGSTDDTVALAENNGARVIHHRFESFAKQRNWALEHGQLKNEWVLMLDADETSTPEFQAAIENARQKPWTRPLSVEPSLDILMNISPG